MGTIFAAMGSNAIIITLFKHLEIITVYPICHFRSAETCKID